MEHFAWRHRNHVFTVVMLSCVPTLKMAAFRTEEFTAELRKYERLYNRYSEYHWDKYYTT